jgi:hypothetical protein
LRGGGSHELRSATTRERGLIDSIDLTASALAHVRSGPLPHSVRGAQIVTGGALDARALGALRTRLEVLAGRRLKALAALVGLWIVLLLLCARSSARGFAVRSGALAVLWVPALALVSAAIEPGAGAEYALIAGGSLALGATSDLLIGWPRAPIAPALVAVGAISVDSLAETQLLMRSLVGPLPALGARFYGIGNELKSALAVLVLAALAGAVYPSRRGRRTALLFACAGALLALIEGSARLGAGVGGALLVSAAFAVACALLLSGPATPRRAVIVALVPAFALIVLALLDLVLAHGSGHYVGSVLKASSAGEVRDVLARRYASAWRELRNHAMPVATGVTLLACALALRERQRLLAPVGGDVAWLACLAGGITAGLVGALCEDSGPLLLVTAVFVLGCVTAYLTAPPRRRRRPLADASAIPRSLGTLRAGPAGAPARAAEPLR